MSIGFFYYPETKKAAEWAAKMEQWLKKHYPIVKITDHNPKFLIVLGGDGTILEATRRYQNATIVGFNLGHVGFLASVRRPKDFLPGLSLLMKSKYHVIKRLMMKASVQRRGERIFTVNALNEVTVQSLLSMVELEVSVENHPIQYVHGTGVLVGTATGSTAYNLSAHGPIIMPGIECFIVTELLDHNIPTPSIVIKPDSEIVVRVINFRKQNKFVLTNEKSGVDVVLSADTSYNTFPLEPGDLIFIQRSPKLVKFAEFEKNYFFKSLQEKFAFR